MISIALLFTGTSIVFYSCTKDNNRSVNKQEEQGDLSANDFKINNLINGFKQKMAYYREYPNLKSGESLPADSALWYLEATINYSHGFPNQYYEGFQTDSIFLTMPKNSDGEVGLTELAQKYNEMKSRVSTAYHSVGYTNKGLAMVDLKKTTEDDNEIVFSVKSITGEVNPDPDTTKYNYIGDWEYGENGGYCNSPNGLGDASEQFLDRINNLIAYYGKTNSFFLDIIDVVVQGGDPNFILNSVIEPDNHLDYYLYYSVDGTGIPWNEDMLCIPDADMHAYNDLIFELLFDFLPNEHLPSLYGQEKYYIMSCLLFMDFNGPYPMGGHEYYHKGIFEYGFDIEYTQGNLPTEIQ